MQFSFAHFSDVHLGPIPPGAVFNDFAIKRLSGGLNWLLGRRNLHLPLIAMALRDDIVQQHLDHIVCTGDVVNLSAQAEFPRAAAYLRSFGPASSLSLVPGNHDAYVELSYEQGWQHFSPWMKAEFPYVHLRKNIAMIGLSSALPQPMFRATGELGTKQLNALSVQLSELKRKGFYRVVMIHHPPLLGQASNRKALRDAKALQSLLTEQGAELVIHGHLHQNLRSSLKTASGRCNVIGVASASSAGYKHHHAAAWNKFSVTRMNGQWFTTLQQHDYDAATKQFRPGRLEQLN